MKPTFDDSLILCGRETLVCLAPSIAVSQKTPGSHNLIQEVFSGTTDFTVHQSDVQLFMRAGLIPILQLCLLPQGGESTDDVRLFGFIRITTGDAMSKRAKFTLITWIGENVSGLQRAKISTDKTLVKDVVQNFAKEFVISDRRELEEDYIKNELKKAGGANYDAQAE
ncbi:Coactosin-like protein [Acipenser ruthenus]|uniref:Coactosin-like protein n=1 Tax=Acipenser ruthenus TaxID=7906 RepID=A0A444U7P1_ACIRT|nr:Coactosin-like protein [Acipenser ruthenus]